MRRRARWGLVGAFMVIADPSVVGHTLKDLPKIKTEGLDGTPVIFLDTAGLGYEEEIEDGVSAELRQGNDQNRPQAADLEDVGALRQHHHPADVLVGHVINVVGKPNKFSGLVVPGPAEAIAPRSAHRAANQRIPHFG